MTSSPAYADQGNREASLVEAFFVVIRSKCKSIPSPIESEAFLTFNN
jgi:hypothetical protein